MARADLVPIELLQLLARRGLSRGVQRGVLSRASHQVNERGSPACREFDDSPWGQTCSLAVSLDSDCRCLLQCGRLPHPENGASDHRSGVLHTFGRREQNIQGRQLFVLAALAQ